MFIYGAGLAGLLAGAIFQDATILEAKPKGFVNHKALLRFRSPAVGDAVGVDFKKVTVRKGVWWRGDFVQPNIRIANMYSLKVVDRIAERSVWNVEPSERFIAPEDFHQALADRCRGRIVYDQEIDYSVIEGHVINKHPVVSTLPMKVMASLFAGNCGDEVAHNAPRVSDFFHKTVQVVRWRVPGATAHQTVYFPSPATNVYRASLVGDMLIAEFVEGRDVSGEADVFEAFGIDEKDCDRLGKTSQPFGKISEVDDAWRREFIFELSHRHGIFSLGRFGTWRNIMMDDVLHDISVIKKLIGASAYNRMKKKV